jgi:UDP-N-acetylglucosamine:LPS N-acetylglucosamine transferase
VTEGGFGVYTGNSPQRIAAQVCELVRDDVKLRRMSERARKLSRPEATREIAADIASVLLHPPRRMKG